MSTIPTSAFADRLQTLSHDEFRSFVADLWSLAGWETSLDTDIVVARKEGRERRLLVLPAGRLARFRSNTPPADRFDRVVSPRIENTETGSFGDRERPLTDARDLRHRLIYGCESDAAARLWGSYFDSELRSPTWERTERTGTLAQVGLVGMSLALVVGAVVVLVFGLPFLEDNPPSPQSAGSTVDGGLDTDIEVGPPEQTSGEPTAIAWNETLYAGSESGAFAAFDGETGERVWSQELGAQVRSPLVANGTVYVRSVRGVHALDAVTGDVEWTYTNLTIDGADDDLAGSASTRLTVDGGSLYVSDSDELVALDARSGAKQWNVTLPGTVTGSPTAFGDAVYLSSIDGVVSAHGSSAGEQLWAVEDGNESFHAESAFRSETGNASLLATGGTTLYEFDSRTGESGWQFPSQVSGELSAPVVLDRSAPQERNATNRTDREPTVYVADTRAYLYALNPETGERRWTYQDPATIFRNPVVGGLAGEESVQSVYLVGSSALSEAESMITAVNTSSGKERWRFESQNESVQVPTVFDGTLYTGTDDGELLALGTENGTEQWRVNPFNGRIAGAVTVVTDPLQGDSVDSRAQLAHDGSTDGANASGDSGISVLETHVSEEVATGEMVTVRATVTNTGERRDNTTVAVDPEWDGPADSTLRTDVDLAPGEARELSFSFEVPEETGSYSSRIHVGDEEYDHATSVTERPAHVVTEVDDPDTVWQEDQTEIIASVRNTGEVEATTPIALEFDGEIVDSTQRTIGPNETVSVTFSLAPENAPAGEYNYSVATNDDVESASLEVLAVDRREDVLPVVTQVFGVALLLSGLALGWRVVTDVRGSVLRRGDRSSEQ